MNDSNPTARQVTAPGPGDALLIVDVQRDFLPGGSLAVPHGDRVVAPLNAFAARCAARRVPVFASRDWHPPDHCSFRDQGGTWPLHCVAGTPGAAFADALALPAGSGIVSKATTAGREALSAFEGTDLHARLQAAGTRRLFVGGLATDYCVKASVLDACRHGYEVVVLGDAIAAVDAQPGNGERAIDAMRAAGAHVVDSRAFTP